jgi:hypothetical protein
VHEAAGLNHGIVLHFIESLERPSRQDGIGMEKEPPFALCLLGSGVHLEGAGS